MRKEPLISICIPTYNREKYLKRLLDSIVSQKEFIDTNDIEIVVDDGPSSDNTESMVKNYIKKYGDKIKYYRNPVRIGMCPAFLEALDLGTGKYLWLFGSDDIMSNNALKIILDTINSDNPVTIIINGDETTLDLNRYTFSGLSDFLTYLGITKIPYQLQDGFFSFITECIMERSYYNKSYNSLIKDGYIDERCLKNNYFNFSLIRYYGLYNINKISFIKSPCLSYSYEGCPVTWKMTYGIVKDMKFLINYIKNHYYISSSSKKFFRKLMCTWYIGWLIVPFKKLLNALHLKPLYELLSKGFRRLLNG